MEKMDYSKKKTIHDQEKIDGIRVMKDSLERFGKSVLELAAVLSINGKPLTKNQKNIIRMVGYADFKHELKHMEVSYLMGDYEDLEAQIKRMHEQSNWLNSI